MEYFDIVDAGGNIINKASRNECHNGSMLLHPVVHIHIINSNNQLLLQKRAANKDIQPGKWDTSVGGHIQSGESVEEAVNREVLEETGIKINIKKMKKLYTYINESEIEREYVYTFLYIYDGIYRKQDSEIDELKFFNNIQILDLIKRNRVTPNFKKEFNLLKEKNVSIK